jgi:hypothetical protein
MGHYNESHACAMHACNLKRVGAGRVVWYAEVKSATSGVSKVILKRSMAELSLWAHLPFMHRLS